MSGAEKRPTVVTLNVSTRKEFDSPVAKEYGPSDQGWSSAMKASLYLTSICTGSPTSATTKNG